MIGKGTYSEINSIISLIKACGKNLRDNGIDQWDESYPSIENITNDIQTETLFTYKIESEIVGVVVLNEMQDEEYAEINWLTPFDSKNIVIHRLAVSPPYQGRGIARKIMEFAEEFALNNNYCSIRLDTFSQNLRNQKFYANRGYVELGSVHLKYKKDHPYICYEMLTENIKKT
ncbi:MAG: GNAT family N-acetyltransferase [Crocinitomicaceae bacterium]|nr:GNAT family N-acetyltransferase [Crocinitomicaceae bacterium]MDG1777208.1 GNAT family N-acetyltransferase [Crocinitomicaceae bacterium]